MEKTSPFHDTLTIERHFKAPVARVWKTFRDQELKSRWFKAPDGYVVAERGLDFRVGGKEVLRGHFPNGMATSYDATIYDIVDEHRIIYAYDLLIDGKRFSVSLVTVELREEAGGTKLYFTEQNTYVNAPADAHASRIKGISWHLDNLAKVLENT
jgi:uncharacterized protein YndB with AHSA1/START domain